jgi:hypothetical protein
MLLVHLMMKNSIMMPMKMLLTMILCFKLTEFNHSLMMNVMNLSKEEEEEKSFTQIKFLFQR